ncbi:DUF1007 family protein [Paracoccus sp. 1_MG-2023]|uniref:DUF1007 family protein n=1 Tax=unclassified Paracoccus (in: a-proteobacteria) TaxID=2688777 RepID=UPI001C090211|nr:MULTISPECIES: DUF1007 family protein [unclassified Paracoccus (in: a-proteobacteria)]MBU2958673.1 DUF1007 family protein [Paracoccus sp. C2R09]MDO6667666.1 DUF1007 family protein [Paracoccus sp. 1_MG-2023]
MSLRRAALIASLMALPQVASAHPHVFIDASLAFRFEDGRLTDITVEWSYDELYSLLIIEDMGLDPDGDGVLTKAENAAIQGFDGDWEEGFDGRLYLSDGDRRIALDDPRDFTAEYRDGRLISHHVRKVSGDADAAGDLRAQVYDPEYYVQFALMENPAIEGAECSTRLLTGDPYAAADAYARAVAEALEEDDDTATEMLSVDIGATGADELRLDCQGPA